MSDRAIFISKGTTPPVGWVYEIEYEGESFTFQAPMRQGLMQQLFAWYRAKEMEWPGDTEMSARVEHYICQLCPKGFCRGGPNEPAVPFLSISSIRSATRLLYERMFKGDDIFVDQKETDRRAQICANCPKNLHGICTGCAGNQFQDMFQEIMRKGRKSQYDNALDTCAVCGCLLRVKVLIKQEVLDKLPKHTYPDNCWIAGTAAHQERK